jgi:hypothetical protein
VPIDAPPGPSRRELSRHARHHSGGGVLAAASCTRYHLGVSMPQGRHGLASNHLEPVMGQY